MHSSSMPARSDALGGDDEVAALVARFVEVQRRTAALQAEKTRVLAEAGALAMHRAAEMRSRLSREREMPMRSIAASLAVAVRAADRTVQRQIDQAMTLAERFPDVLDAWHEARIYEGHVRAILEAGTPIDDGEARASFSAEAVRRAELLSPGCLKPGLLILAERVQPRTITQRHRDARAERRVYVTDLADGMSELTAILPSVIAQGIHDRLTQQARAVKRAGRDDAAEASTEGAGVRGSGTGAAFGPAATHSAPGPSAAGDGAIDDDRTMDQLRADILADMALTSTPQADPTNDPSLGFGGLGAIRAVVHVTVPALALAGTTDDPAELVGRVPIDIDTAKILAGRAPGWDRVLSDPITGGILAVDRYTPGADLKRFLQARDEHCRFPGCRQPVHRCDTDHTVDWALGGQTCTQNLHHLCRRHHSLKHATAWRVRSRGGGALEWTSPTGATYIDEPPSRVRFVPDSDPPPF